MQIRIGLDTQADMNANRSATEDMNLAKSRSRWLGLPVNVGNDQPMPTLIWGNED
jgi:hypothetical protein